MDVRYNRSAPVGLLSSITTVEIQMPGLNGGYLLGCIASTLHTAAGRCG